MTRKSAVQESASKSPRAFARSKPVDQPETPKSGALRRNKTHIARDTGETMSAEETLKRVDLNAIRDRLLPWLREEVVVLIQGSMQVAGPPEVASDPVRRPQWRETTGGGVEEALRRGAEFKAQLLQDKESMWPTEKVAEKFGISRQAVLKQRDSNKALGLEGAGRGLHFPAWQFDDRVRTHLPEILGAFMVRDSWGKYLFLTQPQRRLRGRTPLQALVDGDADRVIEIARALGEDE